MTQLEFEIVRQKVNAKYEGQYKLVESGFSKKLRTRPNPVGEPEIRATSNQHPE